jgi:hypothetical protein
MPQGLVVVQAPAGAAAARQCGHAGHLRQRHRGGATGAAALSRRGGLHARTPLRLCTGLGGHASGHGGGCAGDLRSGLPARWGAGRAGHPGARWRWLDRRGGEEQHAGEGAIRGRCRLAIPRDHGQRRGPERHARHGDRHQLPAAGRGGCAAPVQAGGCHRSRCAQCSRRCRPASPN